MQFEDDLEPKEMVVSIDALASAHGMMTMKGVQQDLREAAKQGCGGWFRAGELCEGTHAERFEKRHSCWMPFVLCCAFKCHSCCGASISMPLQWI